MAYIVEAALFKAEGALVDWAAVASRLKMKYTGSAGRGIHLRWMIHKELGMPTEPFIVWRRPRAVQVPGLKPLTFNVQPADYLFGDYLATWTEGSMCRIVVETSSATGGTLIAFAGSPTFGSSMTMLGVGSGNVTTVIESTEIDGLIVTEGVTINQIRGIAQDWLAQEPGWQQYEVVGLPVLPSEWSNIGKYGTAKQGMVAALTDPQTAAIQRLQRGGPKVGWQTTLPGGEAAPVWAAPTPAPLITEVRTDLLGLLKKAMQNAAPNQQAEWREEVALPPMTNPNTGETMTGGQSGTAKASPFALTLMGASTDPWLALTLGFGTAYDSTATPFTGIAGAVGEQLFDYMVTARWEKGFDGASAPVDMAALVPTPGPLAAVPMAANIVSEQMGYIRPILTDGDWRCSVKLSWDRPADIELTRPRSYGFVRTGLSPAAPALPLMDKRASGGFRYPMINSAQITPLPDDWWQISAIDRDLSIPSASGQRSMRYSICQQDIYGQWSPWNSGNGEVHQPHVDDVRIVTASMQAAAPDNPLDAECDAALTVEFLWDWRIRRPNKIWLAGRLYAAAKRGDPPSDMSVPAGLARQLGGNEGFLEISFTGDQPSAPGATFTALSEDGEHAVTFGTAQGNQTRRYRVRLTGMVLNFASTGHIGMALWAKAQERIPPQRTGDWSEYPTIVAASDPRPPVMTPDVVDLASLPDANGESHALLTWDQGQVTNATGYFIYESTETKLRTAAGLPDPAPHLTLSERLEVLNTLFENQGGEIAANDPDNLKVRELFIRRNEKPLAARSADITLPKGSTVIHLFVVLGVNAGQIESKWPSGLGSHNVMQAIAAPRVMKPAPPLLEVRPVLDENSAVYRARVLIGTRPGPRVKSLHLFRVRVDDAARELDTMGPPVAVIDSSGGVWDVKTVADPAYGTSIASAEGLDTPEGSWKRVWYRVAAFSEADSLRGYLKGRSPASSTAWCVVPPPAAPDLSGVDISWPGGSTGDVLLQWSSKAPQRKTPLGPHLLSVRAEKIGSDGSPLISTTQSLHLLSDQQPAPGESGVYTAGGGGQNPFQYRALIRRDSPADAVQVAIRLTDPVGRTSERLVLIPAGPVFPPGDIQSLGSKVSLSPQGRALLWSSHALVDLQNPAPYKMRVTAYQPLAPGQVKQTSVMLEFPVPGIPLDEPGPIPAGNDPLRIRRNSGGGPLYSYYAFCRLPVQRFVLRVTSPDGTFIEQTHVVS